jgi:hypothetical protein
MKRLFYFIIFAIYTSSIFSACPSGYEAVEDNDGIFVIIEDGASCPAGYEIASCPEIVPAPTTGSDDKGSFTYGACTYVP